LYGAAVVVGQAADLANTIIAFSRHFSTEKV
jgi:hypothetical protein